MMRRILLLMPLVLSACGGGGSKEHVPPQSCRTITVLEIGDSTLHGAGDLLQRAMTKRYGSRVKVTNAAIPGAESKDAPQADADIVLANYGMNDMLHGVSQETYAENLRSIHATILQTPNPVTNAWAHPPEGIPERLPPYVETMEQVAQETGTRLADAYGYMLSRPDWQSLIKDGVHPTHQGYEAIVENITAPAVAEAVEEIGCK